MEVRSEKLLITGGAGFIGSHLCERLLKKDHEIICLDNFNDFYNPKIKENNIANALINENFVLIKGDILDEELLENVFSKYGVDRVIHLAAICGVRPSITSPIKYIDVNIKGTVNLLEVARKYEIKQFIFGSSSSVYGINSKIPFSEQAQIDLQISPYAAAKKAGELYCALYHYLYRIPVTILRFFTVYGPRQRPDMAIYKFTSLMSEAKTIAIFGTGENKRDYTYIDDVIEGIVKSIERIYKFETFNIGNSKAVKLLDLIGIIANKLGVNPRIEWLPEQPGDMPVTYADISKAERMLGYKPSVPIEQGIEKFIDWYTVVCKNQRVMNDENLNLNP